MKKSFPYLFYIILFSSVLTGALFLSTAFYLYLKTPSSEEIKSCLVTKQNKISLCQKNSNYIFYSQLPRHLVQSLIVSEDANFWNHQGFDFLEIKNSFFINREKGHYARGASTITQQLAKNLFLTSEKTLFRKINEALITIKIEKTLSKEEILEKYFNVVQFGPQIFGIKKATEFYFEKEPKDLTPEESAFLIMLLPNPISHSKSFFDKKLSPYASQRIQIILSRLKKRQILSEEEFSNASQAASSLFSPQEPFLETIFEDWFF